MDTSWCEVYNFLKDWQTLLGSLIALAAAYFTIRAMRSQATGEERRHEKHLHRKEMAARARMPDALSKLSAYVRSSGEYLTGQSEELPTTPISDIATLKEVIEHIDDKAAQRTFELVSWYQVQRVRMIAEPPPPTEPNRGDRFYDAVLLQAYVNSLFEYARNEEPSARNEEPSAPTEKPSLEEMDNARKNTFGLQFTAQNEEKFEGLKQIIVRRHEGRKST